VPIQLPCWKTGPGWSELVPQVGPVDAEAELKGGNVATSFMRICGVRERWTRTPNPPRGGPYSVSSHAQVRANVEAMIAAVRRQAVETERFWERYARGVVAVRKFLGV
jgi:hypothetical protein